MDVMDEITEDELDDLLDDSKPFLNTLEKISETPLDKEFDEFISGNVQEDEVKDDFEELPSKNELRIMTSIQDPPTDLEMKPLPKHLEYAFLEENSLLPVVISALLKQNEKERLVSVLKNHKEAFAWKKSDILRISPSFCKHKINFEDDVALIMRTKLGLDNLSFDDLYNNLRVFEHDIKGTTASSSTTQNVAFVSTDNTSSTNDINDDDIEEIDLKWQVAMISTRIKKFYKRTRRKLQFDTEDPVGFDKTKVECFSCYKIRHFARDCIAKGNQDSRRRDVGYYGKKARDNGRRPAYQDDSKALVTIDGEDIHWPGHVKEDTQNYGMIAYFLAIQVLTMGLLNTQLSANDKFGLGYGDYRYGTILSYENEVLQSVFMNKKSDIEDTPVNDRYAARMHATLADESDFKPSEYASCESNFSVEPTTSMAEPVENAPKVVCEPKMWTDAPIIEDNEVLAVPEKTTAEEEDEVEVPSAPTPPSPTTEPSPPPQEPITTLPQAQPAPPSSPPQELPTTTSESYMTILNTLMETYATFPKKKDDDNAAIKEVSAAEPVVFDDEEVTMTMAQTLIKMKAEQARLLHEQMAKRLHDEEVEQAAAREKQEKDDLEKAKVLQQQYLDKQENINWNIVVEQMQEKHLDNVRKYQSLKRKPISVAQAKKNMIVYLKNMAGYKMEHFKGMTYDKVRPIFEREYNKVQTLFKPDKDVEEPTKKRVAKETLLQESFKKLKVVEVLNSHSTQDTSTDYPKEISEEDVKNMLEIIPVSEFKVEALQVKYPLIDWEIYSEGSRTYWKIIRVGGITQAYQSFEDMLKILTKKI
nr:reverse transcriptase domain-containing protein [Tanacetum cinerariifolium]